MIKLSGFWDSWVVLIFFPQGLIDYIKSKRKDKDISKPDFTRNQIIIMLESKKNLSGINISWLQLPELVSFRPILILSTIIITCSYYFNVGIILMIIMDGRCTLFILQLTCPSIRAIFIAVYKQKLFFGLQDFSCVDLSYARIASTTFLKSNLQNAKLLVGF